MVHLVHPSTENTPVEITKLATVGMFIEINFTDRQIYVVDNTDDDVSAWTVKVFPLTIAAYNKLCPFNTINDTPPSPCKLATYTVFAAGLKKYLEDLLISHFHQAPSHRIHGNLPITVIDGEDYFGSENIHGVSVTIHLTANIPSVDPVQYLRDTPNLPYVHISLQQRQVRVILEHDVMSTALDEASFNHICPFGVQLITQDSTTTSSK